VKRSFGFSMVDEGDSRPSPIPRRHGEGRRQLARKWSRSLLRQPRLAQGVENDWIGVRSRGPFHGEFGVETKGLRQSGLRVVRLARERIGGRELPVRVGVVITGIDRLADQVGGGVEMAEAHLGVGEVRPPQAHSRVAWAQPHRPSNIGLGLLELAEIDFSVGSRIEYSCGIRVDRETYVGRAEPLVRPTRTIQIEAFCII
jgi:hypothetical protein